MLFDRLVALAGFRDSLAAPTLGAPSLAARASPHEAPAAALAAAPAHGATGGSPATVRYQVADVERAIAFYTGLLDFHLEQQAGSAFAAVTRGNLRLLLSGPGSSGARPLPDGRRQEPGGWNRIVLYVEDLRKRMRTLETDGVRFRNSVETGPGGSQVQIEDPDGNPIELHQSAAPAPG
jgi:catechol 2,3-dioxygenase-like lactoylglutathione lyase family enzyme